MGEHEASSNKSGQEKRSSTKALLADLQALEQMITEGQIECGIRRIGAEQEMFLVSPKDMSPAMKAMKVLAHIEDPRITTELARFNLEANLSPRVFKGKCLSEMEAEIDEAITMTRSAASKVDAEVLLAGILPTLKMRHLSLDSMTPIPRYRALNDAICQARAGDMRIQIEGRDKVSFQHDNVMLEAANTSFQIHFQVAPDEFTRLYNLAQFVSAPVLAVAVNSPLLFGQKLWSETRIALFQSSVDTRSEALQRRRHPTRVQFGEKWLEGGILDLIREDIARFRIILASDLDPDPLKVLSQNNIPKLSALRLHTGTVWRWNRGCYGINEDGTIPHIRIENRILPAGPTVLDEVANAAFFYGLMAGLGDEIPDVRDAIDFPSARDNFYAAARHGLGAIFTWTGGQRITTPDLILNQLLPLAHQGLQRSQIADEDRERYLGVIEARVRTGQTGSYWQTRSMDSLGEREPLGSRVSAITAELLKEQRQGNPVHTWPILGPKRNSDFRSSHLQVGQIMTTDLFTVGPDDLVDLAASVMEWRQVKHVPVEDNMGKLLGLVSYRDLLTLLSKGIAQRDPEPVPITTIMTKEVITVSPETETLEAMHLMRQKNIGCLPVLEGGRLVGLVTARDFLAIATTLLEEHLGQT